MSGVPADRWADQRILVTIASYRDTDLANTVRSALRAARDPSRVRFSICHQFDEQTRSVLDPWREDPRFAIDEMPHHESRGACWARAQTQAHFDHEPYLLQIDAHTRFAADWDARYVAMLASLDSERPILTNYPLEFTVEEDGTEKRRSAAGPRRLGLEPSRDPGSARQRSEPVDDDSPPDRPGRHHLLAAGHLFTLGRFCRDVPYDPLLYFLGEELSLALRAYTHGYDLYYPHEHLVWHWYDHPSPLHWHDHDDHAAHIRRTTDRVVQLVGDRHDELDPFGLGSLRTIDDYAHASGFDPRRELARVYG